MSIMPEGWETVTLPHTWNAVDGQDGGNDYYRGTCMYVRTLAMPDLKEGERAVLEFLGAAMTAEVYVNGEKVICHEGGYSTFRADITDRLKEENILCVSVDNSANDRVYPQKADFTFYGGIYRDVNLLILPEKHFETVCDGMTGLKVTVQVEGKRAVMTLESRQNYDGKVTYTILAPDGMGYAYWKGVGADSELSECPQVLNATKVAEVKAVSVDGYAKAEVILEEVRLWDGVKSPYLYVALASLEATESTNADMVAVRFGCRGFSFDKDQGFFLNGRSYPLRGVSRHQDRAGVGNALTAQMHEEDLEMILDMGANTIRLAHYQHAQYFYDLCDAAGIVTWAEIPYITQHMPNGRKNTLAQMRELVVQCYNHPSIVCWGLSNEITASGTVTDDLVENHRQLNELCHNLDTTRPTTMAHVFMLETDFTFYGGIYRDVNLLILPEKHFETVCDGMTGLKVTVQVEGKRAVMTLESRQNYDGKVTYTILAPDGMGYAYWKGVGADSELSECPQVLNATKVAEVKAVSVDGYAKAEVILEEVRLWDGVKSPYLYVALASLEATESTNADMVAVRFGCRGFSFDKDQGFFLNGRSYPLRGVSRHQDRAGVGNALTAQMHEEDLEMILDMGANTIRLAHYQHAQYFYDLCDAAGIVTWAEIPYITQHMPNGRKNTLAQMRELVVQCYNHPSIVCWGLSNEITASGTVTDDLVENHRQLNELCHNLDTTRPTTMAHVFMLETDSPLIDLPDIGSYNLYFGWYIGELSENDSFFDDFHKSYPDRIIGFSEYGADANPQYQSECPERGDYTESYQCLYHEHLIKCIEERPYLWATHVWNMFDFAADGREEGGKNGQNQKGLVTMDRSLKKDAYYLYKAYWNHTDAFVHICGRRFADRVGEQTQVKVYSNQTQVELYIDGSYKESQNGAHIFVFDIPLIGEHRIEVRSGAVSDSITIRKAEKENPDYAIQKKEEVVNWFDKEELDVTCFSIEDTMGEIMSTPMGAALIERIMAKARASRGDVAEAASENATLQKMLSGMKMSSLLKQAAGAISAEEIAGLNAALQKIKKPSKKIRERVTFNVDSRISRILAHEESVAVFDRFLPGMRERVASQPATAGFSIRKLVSYAKGAIPEEVLEQIDKAFAELEIYIEKEADEKAGYTEEQPLIAEAAERVEEVPHTAIYPGRPWRDTEGKRIQTHGGALFYEDGTYYWYGENKDRTDGKCPVWTWGIRAYTSKDLYNWEDLGLIIKPDLDNPKSGLYPEKHVDRPHILKCDTTGKYICWIKQSGEEACFLILQADAFTGPYTIVTEAYRPLGLKVGDFDIIKEKGNEKAYLFFDGDHTGIIGMELSADYLKAEKEVSRQYTGLHAPFCREGVALFERNGKKYMLTSGMSGYIPNKSDAAASESWEAPFISIGNPHVSDASNASFNSQISQVFKVPG